MGWYADSASWNVQRDALLLEQVNQKGERLAEVGNYKVELQQVAEQHRRAERWVKVLREDNERLIKEGVDIKKQLGLKEPPLGSPNGFKELWEANQLLAAENKAIKVELDDYREVIKAYKPRNNNAGAHVMAKLPKTLPKTKRVNP